MSYRKVWEHSNAEYRQESADYLRRLFPPGSEVTTTIKNVTRSGMGRTIAVLAYDDEYPTPTDRPTIVNVSHDVARVLNWRLDTDRHGVYVTGCGMDMAFHLTYTLAQALYSGTEHDKGDGRTGYLLNLNQRTI